METISRAAAKEAGEIYYFTGEPCAYGHIAERRVHNYTCIVCDYAWRRGQTLQLQRPLSMCHICGAQVRAPGHATCSTECKQRWDEAKKRAKYELKHRKLCHGCGAPNYRFHKWFCSDECYARSLKARAPLLPSKKVKCLVCGDIFLARGGIRMCSTKCRKTRARQRRLVQYHRQLETGYIAEYNRKTRAKIAAAATVAKELSIMPQSGKLPRRQQKRRLEREKYAVMLAFKRLGLLQ